MSSLQDRHRRNAVDAGLVCRLVYGDQRALERLYGAHAPTMFAYAKRVLLDTSLAEDVVQEVFVWLWNNPERFDAARSTLRGYLLLQTRSRAIDLMRSREASQRRECRYLSTTNGHPPDPARVVERRDRDRLIRGAVEELCCDERMAIELAFFHGMTYQQVAEVLCLPEGTVKSRIRAGLRRLSPALEDIDASTL